MKKIILFLTLSFSVSFFGQTTVESFLSGKLNTKRDITVKLPKSYEKNPDRWYPMILVLDSEYLFNLFDTNLTYGKSWDDMPDVILVGVSQNKNNERYEDCELDDKTGMPTKKSAVFYDFIATELLPHLEKKYRVSNFRGIAGVDVTGAFVNTFLYDGNPVFNAFICISPNLQANMEDFVAERIASIKQPIFYYQATSTEDLKEFREKIKDLDTNIKSIKNPTFDYKFDIFNSIGHYAIAPNAVPSALYQIFSIYQPISQKEYQDKILPLREGHVDYLNKKYETIEKVLGTKLKVRYIDLMAIESAIKKNGDWNEYEQLAQISGQQYEKTMLYDYHMAVYWEKRDNYKKALLFYQSSFDKEPIGDITKDYMMNKVEELKRLYAPKKDKLKGGKGKIQEIPEETAPAETPQTETPPADTPNNSEKPK